MKSSVTLHKNVSYITLSVLGGFMVTLGGPQLTYRNMGWIGTRGWIGTLNRKNVNG